MTWSIDSALFEVVSFFISTILVHLIQQYCRELKSDSWIENIINVNENNDK